MSDVNTILKKVAKYIEITQPQIDNFNVGRELFLKRAHQVAGFLTAKGILPKDKVTDFLNKVASDTSGACVWDLVEKLAEAVSMSTDSLGQPSDIKPATSITDPFERWLLFGDPKATNVYNNL